jgi:hypothetical protein
VQRSPLYVDANPLHWSWQEPMTMTAKAKTILTDSHFLIPLVVFCIGLALLIALH